MQKIMAEKVQHTHLKNYLPELASKRWQKIIITFMSLWSNNVLSDLIGYNLHEHWVFLLLVLFLLAESSCLEWWHLIIENDQWIFLNYWMKNYFGGQHTFQAVIKMTVSSRNLGNYQCTFSQRFSWTLYF